MAIILPIFPIGMKAAAFTWMVSQPRTWNKRSLLRNFKCYMRTNIEVFMKFKNKIKYNKIVGVYEIRKIQFWQRNSPIVYWHWTISVILSRNVTVKLLKDPVSLYLSSVFHVVCNTSGYCFSHRMKTKTNNFMFLLIPNMPMQYSLFDTNSFSSIQYCLYRPHSVLSGRTGIECSWMLMALIQANKKI
jgi:hypothetical protein